jgi:enoyl-CoA hydratase/carnithine racemase
MPDLLYEKRDGIAILTLNRPEQRNAFSPETII